jgi:hypothetical protein
MNQALNQSLKQGSKMFKKSVTTGALLTSLLMACMGALEVSASESAGNPGMCKDDFAFNTLTPVRVTPALLEELRVMSGAALVRHEQPGDIHTQEHRDDRLRVFSDENERFSHFKCG